MAIIKCESGEYQHIYGGIGPEGNILFGEGFRCQKIRYGLYVVEFEREFANPPAVVCTINGNEWQTFNLSVANFEITPWHFVCGTSNQDQPVNSAFTFIAFGQL